LGDALVIVQAAASDKPVSVFVSRCMELLRVAVRDRGL
jgi:hypothetical protein